MLTGMCVLDTWQAEAQASVEHPTLHGLAGEGDYLIRHLNKYVKMLIPTEVPVVLSGTGQWGGAMGAALAAK